MKATGIVRKTDSLGRFVIPKELRNLFGIDKNEHLEVFTDGNAIVIKKFQKACVLCGGDAGLFSFSDTLMCEDCIAAVSQFRRGSEQQERIAL